MYDNDVINNFYVDGNNNTIDSDMSTDTNMNKRHPINGTAKEGYFCD